MTAERSLNRQLEAIAIWSCLAMVAYFFFAALLRVAYEQAGWLSLGRYDERPWTAMRDIAGFGVPRGLRYFLAFLATGLMFLCIEELRRASQLSKLVLAFVVAPIVLPIVLFFATAREYNASIAWTMWAIVCALFYWQAKWGGTWRVDLVIWTLVAVHLVHFATLDRTIWMSALEQRAAAMETPVPPQSVSGAYFFLAETLYAISQIFTGYIFPRRMIGAIAANEAEAELREPTAEETQPLVKRA